MTTKTVEVSGNALIISDLHAPYHHKDALSFLRAIKAKYRPKYVFNVGDECDWHGISYHDKNPDLSSAGHELKAARVVMRELATIFPKMDLIESNHGSLVYRKALTHGLPSHTITGYADTLFSDRDGRGNIKRTSYGKGWTWHSKLILNLGKGHKALMVHGDGTSQNSLTNVQKAGMSFVSGHWHSKFDLQYHSTSEFLHFGMIVGCLVDPHSKAFDYAKRRILGRPVIGCAGYIDGNPKLLPMLLDKRGRWTGRVP